MLYSPPQLDCLQFHAVLECACAYFIDTHVPQRASFLAESELSLDRRTTTSTKSVSFALVPFQLRPSLPPSMTVLPPQGALNSTTKQATTARCHMTTTNPFADLSLASIMTPGPYTALNAPSETSSSKTWSRLCTIGTPTSTA